MWRWDEYQPGLKFMITRADDWSWQARAEGGAEGAWAPAPLPMMPNFLWGPAPGSYQEEHLTGNVLATQSVSLSHDDPERHRLFSLLIGPYILESQNLESESENITWGTMVNILLWFVPCCILFQYGLLLFNKLCCKLCRCIVLLSLVPC